MLQILLVVSMLAWGCAENPAARLASEPVAPDAEVARTAVTAQNEGALFIGKLNWGKDPVTGKPWTVATLRRARTERQDEVAKKVRLVLSQAEGTLKNPPAEATAEQLFLLAFCARVATEATQAACKVQLRIGIFGSEEAPGWLQRLDPQSYGLEQAPVDVTLFRAIDLFFPVMTLAEKSTVRVWLHAFAEQQDSRGLPTWRLASNLTAAVLLEDERLVRTTQSQLKKQYIQDFLPSEGWKPDSRCRNNRNEKLYGSFAFRQRDALRYHVYSLQSWQAVLGAKADAVDANAQAAVLRALDFLKPYYLGKKVHREFVCTTVALDRRRAKAGQPEYQQRRWQPETARTLLRTTVPYFSQVKAWAKPALDDHYPSSLMLVAALQTGQ